ncbi:helix-turn-helix domain-containing protein [Rhodospirillaceae bacterium SYSU D60014]|uniref:helix-turn-helix domain-containing protein n=1 Tax=Virgifigura deserti TaxID=2268457 RepID=UPI000E67410B
MAHTKEQFETAADARHAYTVAEARGKVPMSRNAFYAAIKNGEIPSRRIGGKILIPRGPFDRLFGCEAA